MLLLSDIPGCSLMETCGWIHDGAKEQGEHGSNGGLCNEFADKVRGNCIAALAAFPLHHHPLCWKDVQGFDEGRHGCVDGTHLGRHHHHCQTICQGWWMSGNGTCQKSRRMQPTSAIAGVRPWRDATHCEIWKYYHSTGKALQKMLVQPAIQTAMGCNQGLPLQ